MSDQEEDTPPKVWAWDTESGGRIANINRPVAGPIHKSREPAPTSRSTVTRYASELPCCSFQRLERRTGYHRCR